MATEEFTRLEACLPKINSWTSFSLSSLSSSNNASMSRLRLNAAFSSLGFRLESVLCSSSAMFSGEEIASHTFHCVAIASCCQSTKDPNRIGLQYSDSGIATGAVNEVDLEVPAQSKKQKKGPLA